MNLHNCHTATDAAEDLADLFRRAGFEDEEVRYMHGLLLNVLTSIEEDGELEEALEDLVELHGEQLYGVLLMYASQAIPDADLAGLIEDGPDTFRFRQMLQNYSQMQQVAQ